MSNIALQVEGISKRYRLGAATPYLDAKTSAVMAARRLKRALLGQPPPPMPGTDASHFWALKDVGFEVRHGESVGIIGRNGAGKSTLLKILSRITKPTEGSARVYGRLGSLLEVGTGFHPELSGRENIFLNATILGLSREEIRRRFDEIVDFAEIEKFVDTPIKHYSSGMFMRLAFSVSAHLDSDILILDEVLAVGDAAFQKKCLGKMEDVSGEGRTVLLVSHNVPSILTFCNRCLLLEEGRLLKDGTAIDVTEYYQESSGAKHETTADIIHAVANKTGKARFTTLTITPLGPDGAPEKVLRVGHDLEIELTVDAAERVREANVAFTLFDDTGYRVIDANTALRNDLLNLEAGQRAVVRFTLRNVLLRPGEYRLGLWLGRAPLEDIDIVLDAKRISVEVDPQRIQHNVVFPAVYQCEFTHRISIEPV